MHSKNKKKLERGLTKDKNSQAAVPQRTRLRQMRFWVSPAAALWFSAEHTLYKEQQTACLVVSHSGFCNLPEDSAIAGGVCCGAGLRWGVLWCRAAVKCECCLG